MARHYNIFHMQSFRFLPFWFRTLPVVDLRKEQDTCSKISSWKTSSSIKSIRKFLTDQEWVSGYQFHLELFYLFFLDTWHGPLSSKEVGRTMERQHFLFSLDLFF